MAEPSSLATPKSAAPRRGKFLSGPAQLPSDGSYSSSSSPGGPHLPSAAGANAGGTDGYDDILHDHSIEDLKAHVHNIKTMATVRRKAIESQRNLVLNDLDKAEDLVLALLELASGVTSALSDMTTASTTTKTRRQGGSSELTNNVEEGREDDNNNNNARQLGGISFEELATRVSSGSAGYSKGVKKLHTLLAPHAHYVKSLTNSNKLISNNGTDNSGERSTTSNNYGSLMTATSSCVVSNSKDRNAFGKIIEDATSNMYAVRVKKRLVMERCEVLRQMIQLEEEEEDDDTLSEETGQMKAEEEQVDKPKNVTKRKRR
jgi:hypothetical protein